MMNPDGNNPLWGGNSYCSEDTAAVEMVNLENMDEPVAYIFQSSGDLNPMPDIAIPNLLGYNSGTKKPLTMEAEPGPQIAGSHQYVAEQVKNEITVYNSEGIDNLVNEICGTIEPNYKFLVAKAAEGNEKHKSKNFTMVNENLLYAKPEKDIPIKVVGARFGHVVQVSVRYKAGRHYDTPVKPCPEHSKPTNREFSFSVPRLVTEKLKDDKGHPTLKMHVPSLNSGEDFNFSVLFHCRNSCHKHQGKDQEMILQLFDSVDGGELLQYRIDIRICENVNRDIGVRNDKLQQKKGVKRLNGRNIKVRLPDGTFYKAIAELVKAMKGSVFKLEDHEATP